ncbi:MAG TPA: SdpI family protein [Syntrophales bacterium]|jgi:uncharacterized membrane protein|nr:SdpI family protein [Syntrophales bacterium]
MDAYDKGLITILVCCAIFCLVSIPLVLRKVPRNPIYGYRTRTTLRDDKTWYEANAYFSRRFLIASVLSACIALLLHDWRGLSPETFMKLSVALLAAPVAFAWPLTVRFIHEMVSRDKSTSGHQ